MFIDRPFIQKLDEEIELLFRYKDPHILSIATIIRKKYEYFEKRMADLIIIDSNKPKPKIHMNDIEEYFCKYISFIETFKKIKTTTKELNELLNTNSDDLKILLNTFVHEMTVFDKPSFDIENIKKKLKLLSDSTTELMDKWMQCYKDDFQIAKSKSKYKSKKKLHIRFGCKYFYETKKTILFTKKEEIDEAIKRYEKCEICKKELYSWEWVLTGNKKVVKNNEIKKVVKNKNKIKKVL